MTVKKDFKKKKKKGKHSLRYYQNRKEKVERNRSKGKLD